jgi:hypothetical protein
MSHATKFEQRRKTASRWEDSIPERADALAKRICEQAKASWPELVTTVEQTREDFTKGQFTKFTT